MQNQIVELQGRLQEQQSAHDELLGEMAGTQESLRSSELECKHLHQQLTQFESQFQQASSSLSQKDVEINVSGVVVLLNGQK
jgi:chromosome segregation ATPase